jgi:hypothetical protein
MDNSPVIVCLPNPMFLTNQLLPQRILGQVPDPPRRMHSEADLVLPSAPSAAPTAGSGADFQPDMISGL